MEEREREIGGEGGKGEGATESDKQRERARERWKRAEQTLDSDKTCRPVCYVLLLTILTDFHFSTSLF